MFSFQKVFCLFLLISSYLVSNAQNYQLSQLISFGGISKDMMTHSTIDADGNIFITGKFFETVHLGNDSLISSGNSDMFLVKMDQNMNIVWAKRAGGIGEDWGNRVFVTSSAVYVVGTFSDIADFANPNNPDTNQLSGLGGKDFFIAKYMKNGTFLWARRGGGVSDDSGNGISVLDNEIVVTGGYQYFADFSTPPIMGHQEIVSIGGSDCFVAFYDTLGNFKKSYTLGSVNDDCGIQLIKTKNGYYLAGQFSDTIRFNKNSNNCFEINAHQSVDVFLAKFTSNDVCSWAQSIGGDGLESVKDLAVLGDKILITGSFNQTIVLTSRNNLNNKWITSRGNEDFYLAKYTDWGDIEWCISAGGTYEDICNAIYVTPSEILVCGHFSNDIDFFNPVNVSILNFTSSGFSDLFIVSYNFDGTLIWGRQDGGNSIEYGHSVFKYNNKLYCLGSFNLNTQFGNGNESVVEITSKGGFDVFCAQYSLIENGKKDNLYNIFPIPCFSTLNIVMDPSLIGNQYGIYDLTGKCIVSGVITSNSFFIDVSNYASGFYLFKTSNREMKGVSFIKL